MAAKLKAKTKSRKPAAKKKAKKKISAKNKTIAKSKPAKKSGKKSVKKAARKTAKKPAKKVAAKRAKTAATPVIAAPKPPEVLPGPPRVEAPPVEEPIPQEFAVGVVTHYYSDLGVAVVQINAGELKTGDAIHIKGHTSDFTQQVASMEYEHQHVDLVAAGQKIGLKVVDHAREHDIVFLVR